LASIGSILAAGPPGAEKEALGFGAAMGAHPVELLRARKRGHGEFSGHADDVASTSAAASGARAASAINLRSSLTLSMGKLRR
jgi:hypothetical protein